MSVISDKWPFDPGRVPFFYGWIIWFFSTLGFLVSVPGQTMGMAIFTDYFIEGLGLSRTELSMAYLCGTIGSSLFLTRAGRWYDIYGGRLMISLSSFALGLMIFFISITDLLAELAGGFAFALILIGYFGVRFLGQGILSSCSRNVLLHWFVKRRGLVTGIRGVFVSLGFSLAPLLLAWFIVIFGWRGALWLMAIIVGFIFPILAFIFLRDRPESAGLMPDGAVRSERDTEESMPVILGRSLKAAQRDPVFWIYAGSLGMHALFGTALTFHVVSIFADVGRSAAEALAYFFPSAIFATTSSLIASWLVDRYKLKPFLIMMLIFFVIGASGLLNLEKPWGFWLLAMGFGTGNGLWGVISNLAFIRFYGPLNLGAISGFAASVTVFSSAVGPAAFSLGFDFFGSYGAAVKVCIGLLCLFLIAAIVVDQQEVSQEENQMV